MTTENQQATSEEDKFFGVRTPVVVKDEGTADDGDSGDNLNIEVVEDLPFDQQAKASPEALSDDYDDGELENYSVGVQKRIKKLTFQREEAKRQMGEATLMREEAIRVAKHLSDQNRYQANQLSVGEEQLVDRTKTAANYAVNEAKSRLSQAHETGDTEGMVAAQQYLNVAQYELQKAVEYEQDFQFRRSGHSQQQAQAQAQAQAQRPRQQQAVPPDEKAAMWAKDNPWFGNDEHKEMTALAYGIHEQLIKNEGITPSTDKYYDRINTEMRNRFPEYFNEGSQSNGNGSGRQPVSPSRRPTQVVSPSSRNNGAKPRSVKLTSTAVALAKRLGLTQQQYAKQLAKEMS